MKSEESCLHLVKNTIGCGMKFTMFLREKYLGKKIDSFKAGAGTVLFLYDEATVKKMQEQFSTYADNFPVWANQANGMLQLAVWSMLRELNVGASLQHYNPVIDARVKEIFDIPENFNW